MDFLFFFGMVLLGTYHIYRFIYIYIYIHVLYRYISTYSMQRLSKSPRPSKFLSLFPMFPRFLAPPWFLRSRPPVLPAWCLVRFPLVATLPRPGHRFLKNGATKKSSLQCLTWIFSKAPFVCKEVRYLFRKHHFLVSTYWIFRECRWCSWISRSGPSLPLIFWRHGWSLHSWRHIDGIASFPCFELRKNGTKTQQETQEWNSCGRYCLERYHA